MSTAAKIAGLNGMSFRGNKFSYHPRTGLTLRMPYEGPEASAAASVAGLILSRTPFSYEQDGPTAEITIEGNVPVEPNAPTEVPVDRWELDGNEQNKSIWEHPNTKAIANSGKFTIVGGGFATNFQILGALRADMNLLQTGQQPLINSGETGTLVVTDGPTQVAMHALWELVQGSGDHYAVASPILRHVQSVTDAYAGTAFNFNNSETILTTTQLLAECAAFPFPLPAVMVLSILSIPATSAPGYNWGWRKVPPNGNSVANCRTEFTTQYVSDLWNTGFAYNLHP